MAAPFITTELLYIYDGPTIIIDGVEYAWNGTQYEPTNQIDVDTQSQLGYRKKVVLKFSPYIQPNTNLSPDEVEVYIDGARITDTNILKKDSSIISITFDELYLLTQRVITFKCNRAACLLKYVVKARVNAGNDVVIEEFGIDQVVIEPGNSQSIPVSTDDLYTFKGSGAGDATDTNRVYYK